MRSRVSQSGVCQLAPRSDLTCRNRIPAEINGMMADSMDMPSAVAWRQTCRENYAHVTSSLKRNRLKLVGMFLSPTSAFDTLLGECNGVLGGDAALSYVLRTEAINPSVLDVYLPANTYESFIHRMIRVEGFAQGVMIAVETQFEGEYIRSRQVTYIRKKRFTRSFAGKYIALVFDVARAVLSVEICSDHRLRKKY